MAKDANGLELKVGDKVKCVAPDNLLIIKLYAIYTVSAVSGAGPIAMIKIDGFPCTFFSWRFVKMDQQNSEVRNLSAHILPIYLDKIAENILNLINSKPRSPFHYEIVKIIEEGIMQNAGKSEDDSSK